MCTLSIIPCGDDLVVTMNRDEQRDRHEAGTLLTQSNHCFPVDKRSGGTWVGANQYGLVCSLLNRYQDAHIQGEAQSRGGIIPMLLSCPNLGEAEKQLRTLTVNHFNPFDCIVMQDYRILHATWNGKVLSITKHGLDKPFFITSSSERTDEVIAHRDNIFSEFKPEGKGAEDILKSLHLKGGNDNDESSICMRRLRTHTKSITQIVLTPATIGLSYWTEDSLENGLNDLEASAINHIFPLKA